MKEFSGTLAQILNMKTLLSRIQICAVARYFDFGLGLIFDQNGCIIFIDCC